MPQITWWIFPSLNVHMCFVLGKKVGQLHKTHPTVSVSLLDVLTFYQPSLPLGYRWMRKDWEGKALWVVCLSPPPCVVIFRLCGWWMEGRKIVLGRSPFLGQTHCLLCAVKTSSGPNKAWSSGGSLLIYPVVVVGITHFLCTRFEPPCSHAWWHWFEEFQDGDNGALNQAQRPSEHRALCDRTVDRTPSFQGFS